MASVFKVKSGGHAYNLDQSSTPGVQISMAKFSNLSYDAEQQTVTLGVGMTWEKVYELLEPLGVMVVGGRINPVGEDTPYHVFPRQLSEAVQSR